MKKLILASIIMGFANLSIASDPGHVGLPKDALSISNITGGRIVSVNRLCPPDPSGGIACVVDGTRVVVEVLLKGCLDELGTYAYAAEEVGDNLVIHLNAVNVHTKGSLSVMCFAAPRRTIELVFIDKYGNPELRFLQ